MGDKKKLVLVVDDEPAILRFVKTCLKLSGYEVLTASGGEEALKLVETDTPDIMILDILMQPLTGFDVLERLRAFSRMPVLVFTARQEIAETALSQGADGYITKPFLPEDLVKKIQVMLGS